MSTSKLQRYTSELLSIHLGKFTIKENSRPAWLENELGKRLELDFYIKELGVAIEVQGAQHNTFIAHFHQSYETFLEMQQRDDFKRKKSLEMGIKLYEVHNEINARDVVDSIVLRVFSLNLLRPTRTKRRKIRQGKRQASRPKPARDEPQRTLLAMITYGRMIADKQRLKPRQAKNLIKFRLNMKKLLDSGYEPSKKALDGYCIVDKFLNSQSLFKLSREGG